MTYDANYLIDNKVGITLDAAASIYRSGGSQATWLMTQYDRANGWRIATSHRTDQCGTSRNAPMAHLADPTRLIPSVRPR
jgi:hypothetical protein